MQWDYYLSGEGQRGSRVPPYWVEPPANPLPQWRHYLTCNVLARRQRELARLQTASAPAPAPTSTTPSPADGPPPPQQPAEAQAVQARESAEEASEGGFVSFRWQSTAGSARAPVATAANVLPLFEDPEEREPVRLYRPPLLHDDAEKTSRERERERERDRERRRERDRHHERHRDSEKDRIRGRDRHD